MKFVLIGLVALFSTAAMADFSGNWQGTGQATFSDNSYSPCPIMNLNFTQTAASLAINSGAFNCTNFTMDWTPTTFQINGTQLLQNGTAIGTITSDALYVEYYDAKTQYTTIYNAKVAGNTMNYSQQISNASGVVVVINATFTK